MFANLPQTEKEQVKVKYSLRKQRSIHIILVICEVVLHFFFQPRKCKIIHETIARPRIKFYRIIQSDMLKKQKLELIDYSKVLQIKEKTDRRTRNYLSAIHSKLEKLYFVKSKKLQILFRIRLWTQTSADKKNLSSPQ